MMRIVGGDLRGRRLLAPKGRGVRPTLEVVREAVFDTLGPRVAGAAVLDLFAGSGAMGLEALSRGASHVTWCDASDRAVAAIRENASRLSIAAGRFSILQMPSQLAIRRLEGEGARFDAVFVDPPYDAALYEETMLGLSIARVVVEGGTVVVEHSRRFGVSACYGDLSLARDRRYGETCVAYYVRGSGKEAP